MQPSCWHSNWAQANLNRPMIVLAQSKKNFIKWHDNSTTLVFLWDKTTPTPYNKGYMADWVPIYPIDTKTQQINLLPLLTLFSQSTSSPHSSSVLHGWRIDDDDAQGRSGRLEQPIAAACPEGVPPWRVGFRVSRDITGVSCVSRS
jgi:hypothetical protein